MYTIYSFIENKRSDVCQDSASFLLGLGSCTEVPLVTPRKSYKKIAEKA